MFSQTFQSDQESSFSTEYYERNDEKEPCRKKRKLNQKSKNISSKKQDKFVAGKEQNTRQVFNEALTCLQDVIPLRLTQNRKLHKKQTLQLAIRYIRFLQDCLNGKRMWSERSRFWCCSKDESLISVIDAFDSISGNSCKASSLKRLPGNLMSNACLSKNALKHDENQLYNHQNIVNITQHPGNLVQEISTDSCIHKLGQNVCNVQSDLSPCIKDTAAATLIPDEHSSAFRNKSVRFLTQSTFSRCDSDEFQSQNFNNFKNCCETILNTSEQTTYSEQSLQKGFFSTSRDNWSNIVSQGILANSTIDDQNIDSTFASFDTILSSPGNAFIKTHLI